MMPTDQLGLDMMKWNEPYAWVQGRIVPWQKVRKLPLIGEWLIRCIGAPLNAKRAARDRRRLMDPGWFLRFARRMRGEPSYYDSLQFGGPELPPSIGDDSGNDDDEELRQLIAENRARNGLPI